MITERRRAAHQASAECLARGALGVLQGDDSGALGVLQGAESTAVVAGHLRAAHAGSSVAADAEGAAAAVAAVRLLGADALAPYLLTGRGLVPEESAAVRAALSALPPARRSPEAPPGGPEGPWTRAWIDWGLVTVLSALDPAVSLAVPVPQPPPRCDDGVPRHRPAGLHEGGGEGWAPWSVRMGQLASLALPRLDGPVHDLARASPLALARGATRSMLRRDFATAARIARWLAWLAAEGVALPVDVSLLARDIALRGHDGGRCTLDTAIIRHLLDRESA